MVVCQRVDATVRTPTAGLLSARAAKRDSISCERASSAAVSRVNALAQDTPMGHNPQGMTRHIFVVTKGLQWGSCFVTAGR